MSDSVHSNAGSGFTPAQQRYLEGFFAGNQAVQRLRQTATFAEALGLSPNGTTNGTASGKHCVDITAMPQTLVGPELIHRQAQDRFLSEGKKLSAEEEAKRKKDPFSMWDEMAANADAARFPKGTDAFLYKYHGLFYVSPAQNAFMARLRFAGGILPAYQMRGLAGVAEQYAGGYCHVTTRANLQLREIKAEHGVAFLQSIQELGVVSRGSGADNIRNVTGSPTAGIDPQEIIDVRPLCKQMHHYILNHREMYGLPRKFNISFDGGGRVSVLEDTNDIGFAAVRVGEGKSVPAGVYFRLTLGGITGHRDFARDTGVLVTPEQCVPVAAAIVRVFIEHGDRTDRKKARLKYVLDAWGFDRYLEEVQKQLPFTLSRLPLEEGEPRGEMARMEHIGIHEQKQADRVYVGVAIPVGRLEADQMRGIAALAERYGSGDIRLTVWQNLLIPDVAKQDVPTVERELMLLGLGCSANSIRAGLVACTGNRGCKYAASDTKGHALAIAQHCDERIDLDQPLNIHLTGCHHSCAQHFIGDIGLLGTKVEVDDDTTVEGYRLFIGGGYGPQQEIARELFSSVTAEQLPEMIESLVGAYQQHRCNGDESFWEFCKRHSTEAIADMLTETNSAVAV